MPTPFLSIGSGCQSDKVLEGRIFFRAERHLIAFGSAIARTSLDL
jgi:hypothetical protein